MIRWHWRPSGLFGVWRPVSAEFRLFYPDLRRELDPACSLRGRDLAWINTLLIAAMTNHMFCCLGMEQKVQGSRRVKSAECDQATLHQSSSITAHDSFNGSLIGYIVYYTVIFTPQISFRCISCLLVLIVFVQGYDKLVSFPQPLCCILK